MASQIVSYLIISVCGLIQAPLLSPCIYFHPQGWMGCQDIEIERKEERMR